MITTKLICQASSLSRGLDTTNPEYQRKPRHVLANELQRVIRGIHRLEKAEYDSGVILATCRDIACGLANQLDESEFDRVAIKQTVIDMIQCFDGED